MKEIDFLNKIHKRLAQITIGSSALRNQGSPGLVSITRKYLEYDIILEEFFKNLSSNKDFTIYLNKHTESLLRKYPKEGKSWGAARKSLNLFFRELVYNKFIADHFNLSRDWKTYNNNIQNLEIPLDKDVARGIIINSKSKLAPWISIKSLNANISNSFQDAAKVIADRQGIPKIHLDLLYWRPKTQL